MVVATLLIFDYDLLLTDLASRVRLVYLVVIPEQYYDCL